MVDWLINIFPLSITIDDRNTGSICAFTRFEQNRAINCTKLNLASLDNYDISLAGRFGQTIAYLDRLYHVWCRRSVHSTYRWRTKTNEPIIIHYSWSIINGVYWLVNRSPLRQKRTINVQFVSVAKRVEWFEFIDFNWKLISVIFHLFGHQNAPLSPLTSPHVVFALQHIQMNDCAEFQPICFFDCRQQQKTNFN